MSSFPSDIDGPLPLAGTRAAEKAGFSVDPTKRQIFGGAAVEGAKEINEALKEEDSKAMGKVLKPIILTKEGETATTGGGLEVYGKQLVSPALTSSFRFSAGNADDSLYP
jgi:hypothetical protein